MRRDNKGRFVKKDGTFTPKKTTTYLKNRLLFAEAALAVVEHLISLFDMVEGKK
jgi:hypothetical protein